eukprot:5819719-Pyramimonas_sp.AAC.1
MTTRNARILMNVGLAMAGQQYPCLVGGDWNMSIDEVEASGFPVHAQVGLVSPGQITCGGPTSATAVDFFALSSGAMRLMRKCQ